jgi:hypothetical protein
MISSPISQRIELWPIDRLVEYQRTVSSDLVQQMRPQNNLSATWMYLRGMSGFHYFEEDFLPGILVQRAPISFGLPASPTLVLKLLDPQLLRR